MKIAIDAMGADNAPHVEIQGAIQALRESHHEIVLVGPKDDLQQRLSKAGVSDPRLTVHHASEVIGMHESPAVSVRRKKDSSINVAVSLLKEGAVGALVSAGNTGAFVCAATLRLGLLDGVARPGIGVVLPTVKDFCLLLDAGANIDPKPLHMLHYAVMGRLYAKYVLHKPTVRVGLLNIGEEESKGTEFVKETHELLQQHDVDFVGNVEGRDLFNGKVDVVVCDGYTGNVALKVAEGLGSAVKKMIKQAYLESGWMAKLGAWLSRPAFATLQREMDYAEFGGAPLLGVNGRCIICHGSSNPKAIKNAILAAGEFMEQHLNQHIVSALAGIQPSRTVAI